MKNNIHSCSYYCHIPACIKAQRDELRDKFVESLTRIEEPVSVPQDVEEFIDAHGYVAGEFDEVDLVVTVGSLRAWMAGHVRVPKEALIELVRISDRDHKVWNIVKEAIKES